MIRVFVYSTSIMKNGRFNQHYLQGKMLLGKGYIEGYKKYILGGLDGILPETGERVQGEVYEIDSKTLAKLDFFHNHDTAFTRRIVDVALEDGDTLQAEAYIWKGSVR